MPSSMREEDIVEASTSRLQQTPSPPRSNTKSSTALEKIINLDTPQQELVFATIHPSGTSMVQHILDLEKIKPLSKVLKNVDSMLQINEMPKMYDGNLALEFVPTIEKVTNQMDLMKRHYDTNYWTHDQTMIIIYLAIY